MGDTITESIFILLRDIGVFGLIIWAIQRHFEKSSIKEIEKYKLLLSKENQTFQQALNIEFEKHKSDLEILSFKFSKLHGKRIEVLSSLYEKLAELQILMLELTAKFKVSIENFEQVEKEKLLRTADVYNDFMMYFMKNEIFIEQDTCDLLTDLRNSYYDAIADYEFAKRISSDPKFAYELLSKANVTIRKNANETLTKIKNDCRKIMDNK